MPTSTPSSDAAAAALSVAIIGRPNVGKSTLFNRLVGKRLALVDDQPGVTRDLREGAARLGALRFTAIDTAGLEDATDDSLPARMRRLTEQAIEAADVCLFVIDARAGVTPTDAIFADLLRKRGVEAMLVANKCESRASEPGLLEAYELGLGEPIAVSAEHGEGMSDLLRALEDRFDEIGQRLEAQATALVEDLPGAAGEDEPDAAPDDDSAPDRPLRIAVIGRPNAGKSTLINTLIGRERLLTGPEAGITRDSIAVDFDWGGRAVRLFDTAGMRRKAKVQEKLEKLSVADGLRAARFAEIVILLIDAENPLESQDLRIADLIEREGRAVVIAVNKWDLVSDRQRRLNALREELERLLPQLRGAPMVAISGLTGAGLDKLRAAVLRAEKAWNARASTAQLNRWLAAQAERHPPPAPSGRRLRLRYITQAKSRPPTFVLFCSKPDALPESYRRFLVNGLRETLGLEGAPVRLLVRGADNPYAEKAKKRR